MKINYINLQNRKLHEKKRILSFKQWEVNSELARSLQFSSLPKFISNFKTLEESFLKFSK